MDYLQTDALSVGYNGKTLISKVALSVQRGRIVTLIGPNGSGKSTILKTIIGQLPSISGSVFLDGADMRSRSRGDVARRMAILMTARMDPELMTCRDVVSTGRYPYTGHLGVLRPEDKAIVEQSLRETDALDFADRPFQSISDGQRQRVLLARALCQQPELIVLDEPTSFLDIRYKLELLSILKRMVREEHLAVLMSLHELDLAARVSDTVVCVAGDRIDRVGPPSEIFTPDYIAASRENTIPASIPWNLSPEVPDERTNRNLLCRLRRARRPGAADAPGRPRSGEHARHRRAADGVRPDARARHRARRGRFDRKIRSAAPIHDVA